MNPTPTPHPEPKPAAPDFREPWSAGGFARNDAAVFDAAGVQVACGCCPSYARRLAGCISACRGVRDEVLDAGLCVTNLILDAADCPKMTDALARICLRAGNLVALAAIGPWPADDLLKALEEIARLAREALA